MSRAARVCAVTFIIGVCPGVASGQTYPDRPIRLLLGYGAGGAADIVARVITPPLSKQLGRS
jgi:tripartite-type tricarboxylate transporter receptor subunit TctC